MAHNLLIFEPLTVRSMTLRNRILMAPMGNNLGYRSHRAIAFYAERAKGGVAAITCAAIQVATLISDEAWGKPGATADFLSGLRRLTQTVHESGAKIGLQLTHENRLPAGVAFFDKRGRLVAPSHRIESGRLRHPAVRPGVELFELTIAEIEEIISAYAKGALAVKDAGFDFVCYHGAHGHLASQFFSPLDNRRTDRYGGSLEGRMQFGLESIAAMRSAVGNDYPIWYRFAAREEDISDGITIEDSAKFAVELEKVGVDLFDVSVGSLAMVEPLPEDPMGTHVALAAAIKARVKVPVAAVGRINTPEIAESVLRDNKADLVTIGRQLFADPHWVVKVSTGRSEEIVPCIGCGHCDDVLYHHGALECAVNPLAGKESVTQVAKAERTKKVLVVGGGPAGMEAAAVAAERGHQVILFEKSDKLGGQLCLASSVAHKQDIARFNKGLIERVQRSGATIKLKTPADERRVLETGADAVILATGARPLVPDIAGVALANVAPALEVLAGRVVGRSAVVVGGRQVGCEVAEFLKKRGVKVTVLTSRDYVGFEAATFANEERRLRAFQHLIDVGVEVVINAEVQEITPAGVKAKKNGAVQSFNADTVVLATGMKPDNELAEQLKGKVKALYPIGDCVATERIAGAIHSGFRVGSEL